MFNLLPYVAFAISSEQILQLCVHTALHAVPYREQAGHASWDCDIATLIRARGLWAPPSFVKYHRRREHCAQVRFPPVPLSNTRIVEYSLSERHKHRQQLSISHQTVQTSAHNSCTLEAKHTAQTASTNCIRTRLSSSSKSM